MAIKIRTSKDIDVRFMHQLGKIGIDYDTMVKVFGPPNLNTEMGDVFDGNETRAWHIEFIDEKGRAMPARIVDDRSFGDTPSGPPNTRVWVVQGRDDKALALVRQALTEFVQYNKKRTGDQTTPRSSAEAIIIK